MSETPSVPGLPARYRIEGPLGAGGQAQTWEATDTGSGHEVVVKVFRLAGAEAWKRFELFERECAVLRSLEHRSVPRYIEHGGDEDSGTFYLVMQRSPGETLQSMIDRGRRFTDAELDAIAESLLDTLGYLHALNPPVIHRDVKPGNVLVADDAHVSLVDFGSVRDAVVDTRQSTVVGTYGYMAPEQLRGQSSPASDLYGLGATLAAAATGADAAKLPSNGLEVDLSGVMKPGQLRDRLEWLLAANPLERPGSVEAFRRGNAGAVQDAGALARRDEAGRKGLAKPSPAPDLFRRQMKLAAGSGLSFGLLALLLSGEPVAAVFAMITGVAVGMPFAKGFYRVSVTDQD